MEKSKQMKINCESFEM